MFGLWLDSGKYRVGVELNHRAEAMHAPCGRGNTKYPSKVLVFPPSEPREVRWSVPGPLFRDSPGPDPHRGCDFRGGSLFPSSMKNNASGKHAGDQALSAIVKAWCVTPRRSTLGRGVRTGTRKPGTNPHRRIRA